MHPITPKEEGNSPRVRLKKGENASVSTGGKKKEEEGNLIS